MPRRLPPRAIALLLLAFSALVLLATATAAPAAPLPGPDAPPAVTTATTAATPTTAATQTTAAVTPVRATAQTTAVATPATTTTPAAKAAAPKPRPKAKAKAAAPAGFHRDTTPLSPAVTGEGGSGSKDSGASSVGSVMRMLLGLVIVIGVIFAVYWLLRRSSGRKRGGSVRGDGRMSVVSSTPLPSGGAVHLVRVGDELVLVGSTQHGVTPIRVYTADESQRLGVALDRGGTPFVPTGRPAPGRGAFRANLVEELRRRTTRG